MYYVMRASAPSLHRESTDSLIICIIHAHIVYYNNRCVIRYIHSSYIGMNVCDSIYDNGVWSMACVL